MRQTDLVLMAALSLALLVPGPARAGLTLAGIDGISSTVLEQDQSSFSGLALRARLRSDALVPQLVFMPTLEYWRSHTRVRAQTYDFTSSRKDATLGLDARWEFKVGNARPYLGAGYGIHFLSAALRSTVPTIDDSDAAIRGGLAALGGLTFPLAGKLENFVEAKYHHLPGATQVKLNWGLSYNW